MSDTHKSGAPHWCPDRTPSSGEMPTPDGDGDSTARIVDCDDGDGDSAPRIAISNGAQQIAIVDEAPGPASTEAPEPCGATRHSPPDSGADAIYVVSDGNGYIGAYPSAAVAEAAMRPHPLIPFIIQRFAVAPGPVDSVWVVLYRDLDAVAFVSNDREEAARVQQIYAGVGLAYPDEIDYWEQPFGVMAKSAAERLDVQTRAYQSWAGASEADLHAAEEADLARAEALCAPRADGPLARAFRENERITILDAVIPWSGPASAPPCCDQGPGAEKHETEGLDCGGGQ